MRDVKMGKDKRFLTNNPHERGSVCWHAEITSYGYNDSSNRMSATLTITDCSEEIHLDFDCNSRKAVAQRIKKLDTLIDSLQKFREVLVTALERMERTSKVRKGIM